MLSSSGAAAHSEKGGATAAVGAEGEASKADGAGIGIVTGLSGRSQPSQNQETPPCSDPPTATAGAAAAASNLKKVHHPEMRFAGYKLASKGQPNLRGGGSKGGGWGRTGPGNEWLQDYLKEPRRAELEEVVYYEDELCVVIYDGFPKAQYHLLLIAKNPSIKKLTELRQECLPSQRRLHAVARAIAEELCRQGAGRVRCGYHAIPSVEPLHMHIISQDFDSPDLFTKRQWNGFTTDFFLDLSWVETQLEEQRRIAFGPKKYRKLQHQAAKCFRCGWAASVESLKQHIVECGAPLPGGGATRGAKKSRRGKST